MIKSIIKQKINSTKQSFLPAFTLIELMITIAVIAVLAGVVTFAAISIQKNSRDSARDAQVSIISTSLEKYYRTNGEYPSVALMTSTNTETVKQKLKITDDSILKLPNSTGATSIVTTDPSATKLVYAANTSDASKNGQCNTDVNGYCDGFTLQYIKESTGTAATIQSLNSTFEAVRDSDTCAEGDTKNGDTCTHSYAAVYQAGAYTCPSGGTLSGTTCTNSYGATYANGGTSYYCPSGGTLSGTTCTTSYGASYSPPSGTYTCPQGGNLSGSTCTITTSATLSGQGYSCPNGGSLSGSSCVTAASESYSYYCAHPESDSVLNNNCRHERPAYGTKVNCQNAGYTWGGSNCFNLHYAGMNTNYSCSGGWSLSGSQCTRAATYNNGSYSCPGGYSLSGSTCTRTYAASFSGAQGYYHCPSGGSLSGSSCYTSYSASSTSYPGYYYCSGSGSLSGSTCTHVYNGTQATGYYTCPNGGVASGNTCTSSYELQG